LGKLLVIAPLKGRFAIWLKKYGIVNPACKRLQSTFELVANKEYITFQNIETMLLFSISRWTISGCKYVRT
jgi:hypothetical protein